MSTDYRPLTPIYFTDLFDGRLESAGVHEPPTEDRSSRERCLTDGRNFLWVFCDDKGLASFTRRGWNAPDRILRVIAEKFDVDIVSEYEPEYWGYETEEEWHAAWEAMGEKDVQDFYDEVVKFVRGESHNIEPGTIGMTQAEIAKRLAAEFP